MIASLYRAHIRLCFIIGLKHRKTNKQTKQNNQEPFQIENLTTHLSLVRVKTSLNASPLHSRPLRLSKVFYTKAHQLVHNTCNIRIIRFHLDDKKEVKGRRRQTVNIRMENYQILGRIGEGAHGVVLKAKHIIVRLQLVV